MAVKCMTSFLLEEMRQSPPTPVQGNCPVGKVSDEFYSELYPSTRMTIETFVSNVILRRAEESRFANVAEQRCFADAQHDIIEYLVCSNGLSKGFLLGGCSVPRRMFKSS